MQDLTLTVGGHPYTFARLDARTYESFVHWATDKLPDPVDDLLAVAAKLPVSVRDQYLTDRIDAACDAKRQRGSLTDPDLHRLMQTPAGLKKLFHLLLAKHHPHLTADQCFEVVLQAQDEHGETVFDPVFAAVRPPLDEQEVEEQTFRRPRVDRAAEAGE